MRDADAACGASPEVSYGGGGCQLLEWGPWPAWAKTANRAGEEMGWPAWVPAERAGGGSGGGLLGVASATVLRAGRLPATGCRWLVAG